MIIFCGKCKTQFDSDSVIEKRKVNKRLVQCPQCKTKHEIYRQVGSDYIYGKDGNILRKFKEVKVSKKQRNKIKKAEREK